jgi:hypothetical protein
MNTAFPKLTVGGLITALTYIVPGLLVFEIVYSHGYFTGISGEFSFPVLLLYFLWAVTLSLPFHFCRWLFLRPVKQANAAYVPAINALFVLLLLAAFYIFAVLFDQGYINFGIRREATTIFLALSGMLTAIVAFPLGILYPKLVAFVISWRERKAGDVG